MKQSFLNLQKVKLRATRKRLVARLAELKTEDPFFDVDRVNDNASLGDDAAEESGHERIEVIVQSIKKEIEQLDAALARLEAGSYGVCERCHGQIEKKRLEAVPTSTMCVACLNQE